MYSIHEYATYNAATKDGQGYLNIWYRKLSLPRQYLPINADKDNLIGQKIDTVMKDLIQRSRSFDTAYRAGWHKRANINSQYLMGGATEDILKYNDYAVADWTGFEVSADDSDMLTIVHIDMKGATYGTGSFGGQPAWKEELHLKFNICSESLSYDVIYFVKYDPITRLITSVSTTWPTDTSYTVILYEDCLVTKNFDISSITYETKSPNGNACGVIKFNFDTGSTTPTFYIWGPDAANTGYNMFTRLGSFLITGYNSGSNAPSFTNGTDYKNVVNYLNRLDDTSYYKSGVVMLSQTHQEVEIYSRI